MANPKRITLDTQGTGLTAYSIVRREADGFLLNDSDGSFASSPADPYVPMAEHAVIKGRFERDESRTVWDDGRYTATLYQQTGGSPAPASDTVIGSGEMYVKDDSEVVLDKPVSSLNDLSVSDISGVVAPGVLQDLITVSESQQQIIVRGDAKTLVLSAGAGWNMTGKRVFFMAKVNKTDDNSNAIADIECTVTDPQNGVAEAMLGPDETNAVGLYHAEFEMRDSDGTGNPKTIMQFELKIIQDIRQ